jgi:hypothetical protein
MNWIQYPAQDVAQTIQTRKKAPPAANAELLIGSAATTGEPTMLQAITL